MRFDVAVGGIIEDLPDSTEIGLAVRMFAESQAGSLTAARGSLTSSARLRQQHRSLAGHARLTRRQHDARKNADGD